MPILNYIRIYNNNNNNSNNKTAFMVLEKDNEEG